MLHTDFNSAVVPNHHVKAITIASVMEGATPEHSSTSDSRTELDSHANMFVGGNGTTIIATRVENLQMFVDFHLIILHSTFPSLISRSCMRTL